MLVFILKVHLEFGHSIGKMCIIAFNGIPSPQSQRNRSSTLFSFLNALLIKQQFRQQACILFF